MATATTTKRGEPLTTAEHSEAILACELVRDAYKDEPLAEALVELAEVGLGMAVAADLSIPAAREGIRRSAKRLQKAVEDAQRRPLEPITDEEARAWRDERKTRAATA